MNLRYLSIAVCLGIVSLASNTFAVQDFAPRSTLDTNGQYRQIPRTTSDNSALTSPETRIPRMTTRATRGTTSEFTHTPRATTSEFTHTPRVASNPSRFRQQPVQQQQSLERVTHPEIRDELFRRVELDQQSRQRIIDSARNAIDRRPDPELVRDRIDSDRANRQWLAELLRNNNNRWPGKTMVGQAGAHAAWLIVQHSDDDPTFQMRCLSMMRAAAEGEVAMIDIAFLTDEVLIARNEKQRYGTQVQMRNGTFRVAPVDDVDNLNARRAALGLETIEVYLDSIRANYQARTTSTIR